MDYERRRYPLPCYRNFRQPLQTAENRYVLLLRGGKRAALDGHVSAGDIISVRQGFHAPAWGEVPQRILNAFHGYPSIVSGGALQDGEYNDFENGREHEKSSRVMAGISADKTRLYITTTEMSGRASVDCIELAAWMVEKGASDVVNFDSGGSAAIVIDEQMLNVPGRGSVRPVKDAVLAVSTAPADANEHHITFSRPSFETSVLSLMPLKVMVCNRTTNFWKKVPQAVNSSAVPPTRNRGRQRRFPRFGHTYAWNHSRPPQRHGGSDRSEYRGAGINESRQRSSSSSTTDTPRP